VLDGFESLADESGNQHGLGFCRRDAARFQIKEVIVVQVAAGGAVTTSDIIGIDLEFRLGIEFCGL